MNNINYTPLSEVICSNICYWVIIISINTKEHMVIQNMYSFHVFQGNSVYLCFVHGPVNGLRKQAIRCPQRLHNIICIIEFVVTEKAFIHLRRIILCTLIYFLHGSGQWNCCFRIFFLCLHMSFKYLTSPKPSIFYSDFNKLGTHLQICGFIPVTTYLIRHSLHCCHYPLMYMSKYF